jgi:hypothetical protein
MRDFGNKRALCLAKPGFGHTIIFMTDEIRSWIDVSPQAYIRFAAARLLDGGGDPDQLRDDLFIKAQLDALTSWKDEVINNHKKAGLYYHRLAMLADLGITVEDLPVLADIAEGILSRATGSGELLSLIELPKVFGGSGEARLGWIMCDYPMLVSALMRLGVRDYRLDAARDRLIQLFEESEADWYSCAASIPKFKGPGKRGSPCPYANLAAVRALGADEIGRQSRAARSAGKMILSHWREQKEVKHFLFGIGSDFRKLKFPLVWYDLLHVLSALSDIPGLDQEPEYRQMRDLLAGKAGIDGRFTAESMYMAYKGEDFADKKNPSRLISLLCHRILSAARQSTLEN